MWRQWSDGRSRDLRIHQHLFSNVNMAEKFKRCSSCHVYYVNSGPLQADSSPTIWSHGTNLWTLEWTRDPPPGVASQLLWAGIENTGQSVSHSVPTPALRVHKTHLGANLGARNLCGKILELFVFSLAWRSNYCHVVKTSQIQYLL